MQVWVNKGREPTMNSWYINILARWELTYASLSLEYAKTADAFVDKTLIFVGLRCFDALSPVRRKKLNEYRSQVTFVRGILLSGINALLRISCLRDV